MFQTLSRSNFYSIPSLIVNSLILLFLCCCTLRCSRRTPFWSQKSQPSAVPAVFERPSTLNSNGPIPCNRANQRMLYFKKLRYLFAFWLLDNTYCIFKRRFRIILHSKADKISSNISCRLIFFCQCCSQKALMGRDGYPGSLCAFIFKYICKAGILWSIELVHMTMKCF